MEQKTGLRNRRQDRSEHPDSDVRAAIETVRCDPVGAAIIQEMEPC